MAGKPAQSAGIQPLIPDRLLDVPSQRFYYLSLGLLLQVSVIQLDTLSARGRRLCHTDGTDLTRFYPWQAIKVFDILQNIFASDTTTYYGTKWLIVDFLYIATLSRLRIPRLKYSNSVVLLQILAIWFLDGLFFGGISLNFGLMGSSEPSSTSSGFSSKFSTNAYLSPDLMPLYKIDQDQTFHLLQNHSGSLIFWPR